MSCKLSRIHYIQEEQGEAEKAAEAGRGLCGASVPFEEKGGGPYTKHFDSFPPHPPQTLR